MHANERGLTSKTSSSFSFFIKYLILRKFGSIPLSKIHLTSCLAFSFGFFSKI